MEFLLFYYQRPNVRHFPEMTLSSYAPEQLSFKHTERQAERQASSVKVSVKRSVKQLM